MWWVSMWVGVPGEGVLCQVPLHGGGGGHVWQPVPRELRGPGQGQLTTHRTLVVTREPGNVSS